MESKTFKVKIGENIKEVHFKALTGRDQLKYVKNLKTMDENTDPEAIVTSLNKLIADASGLTEEELLDMNVEDKDALGEYLMEKHLAFAKGFKNFLKG